MTTSGNGSFLIDDINIGDVAPGTYRIDVIVTHNHATDPGAFPVLNALLGDLDALLACQPAYTVVVT